MTEPRPGYTYDPVEPIPEHMQPPPPSPHPKNRLKDTDTSETAFKLKAFTWSGAGGIMGMMAGALVARGLPMPWGLLAVPGGFILGWAIVYAFTLAVATSAARAGASIYMPAGSSTPPERQYSLAQSYVARGRYLDGAAEYEKCTTQFPTDPEPYIRLARLYRDELQRPEDAILWFKRACAIPDIPAGTDVMASRELIEVFTHRLKQPNAAMPYLARLAARHPDTPAGDWAKRELADTKQQLREELQ